jgi:glutamyl-tRNA reductase
MPMVDVVIASVTSPEYLLLKSDLQNVMKKRFHRPLVLIDLGVPRTIDPAAHALKNLFLYDLDSLQTIVDQSLERRRAELPKVYAIILQELREFSAWLESLQVVPTLSDLRTHFESIRSNEVEKHIMRFDEDDRELVQLLTKRIINKLLHEPMVQLRNNHKHEEMERTRFAQIVRQLFGLEKHTSDDTQ